MNEIVPARQTLPAIDDETRAIGEAATSTGGFEKMLFFKKGTYTIDKQVVEYGTEYIAHCVGWTFCWIKFNDGAQPTRFMYRVGDRKNPPADRQSLGDLDQSKWGPGLDGKPRDPWIFQHYLPLQDNLDEMILFCSGSARGGQIAISDLCKTYTRRVERTGMKSQPRIKLSATTFHSKKFGDVARPLFEIIGWNDAEGVRQFSVADTLKEEMNDEIPF